MKLRYKVLNGILVVLIIAFAALALTLSHNSACRPAADIASGSTPMQAIIYSCYVRYWFAKRPQPWRRLRRDSGVDRQQGH